MKYIIRFVFISAVLICGKAMAWECSVLTPSYTINLPATVTVQRDATVGQPITDWYDTPVSNIYNCTGSSGTGGSRYMVYEHKTLAAGGTTYTDGGVAYSISPTNIPGVGVIVRAKSKGAGPLSGYYNFPYGRWISDSYKDTFTFQFAAGARLIKTDKINAGMVSGKSIGYVDVRSESSGAYYYNVPVSFTGSTVTVLACSVTTPTITFPIGDIAVSKFGTSVGTVPAGARNTQNLGLNCDTGVNINVTLQGIQNPDVSNNSVLALTGQGSADVARGVGVQLLYNGSPLALNNRIALKQSSGGQETFPITAQYYQTKTSVAMGKANASATLELTYQ